MRLLIADDHTLFRDALVQYIERAETGAQVSLAKDFYEAFDIIKASPDQDLIVLDLRMPGMNGMEGFKTVREQFPTIPVALMSGVAEPEDVRAAMALGAAGYFPKTLSGKALIRAIQQVLTGERFMPLDAKSGSLMSSYYDDRKRVSAPSVPARGDSEVKEEGGISARNVNLTPRETEVLSHLAYGASNKEIARELDLQVVTVKLHVRGICRKLDAKNRTQAALRARELGLVHSS